MFSKNFFLDRLILSLGFLTSALATLNVLFIILRVDFNQVQKITWRLNLDGNLQLYTTDGNYFYAFIIFTLLVLIFSWMISYKIYDSFKPAAYATFYLAQIVLVANFLLLEAALRVT